MTIRSSCIVILLLVMLPGTSLAYSVPEDNYWSAHALFLINASRAEHGLPAVGLDSELTSLAQAHAEDSALHYDDASEGSRRSSYLMHKSSDGRELPDRVREHSITGGRAFGENVGLRYRRPFSDVHGAIQEALEFMHETMMAETPPDDGHRRTILGDYTHVGIGLELHNRAGIETNTLFIVADFGTFIDGRAIVIPEIGPPPQSITVLRTREPRDDAAPLFPTRRHARDSRSIDLQTRRTVPDVIIPSQMYPGPQLTWAARNQQKVLSRQLLRVKRLREGVLERRQWRMEVRVGG